MKAKVFGRPALFCGEACRDGFREDRKHGLIYGPYLKPDGKSFYLGPEEMSIAEGCCAYCNGDPDEVIPDSPRFDYQRQCWVERVDGVWKVSKCGHPDAMKPTCCYAGEHAGEEVNEPTVE